MHTTQALTLTSSELLLCTAISQARPGVPVSSGRLIETLTPSTDHDPVPTDIPPPTAM